MEQSTKLTHRAVWLVTKVVSVLAVSAAISVYLIRHSDIKAARLSGDLSGLLFGAASFMLAVFAAITAIAAIAGWQSIKLTIQERVDAAQKEVEAGNRRRIELLEKEMRGRALFGLGYMTGEMSIDPQILSVKESNSSRMRDAIRLCELGYDFLKDVEGSTKFMALNNLIFYSCALGDEPRKDLILAHARVLKKAALENDAVNLLLTASRAFLQYGSEQERRASREMILALKKRELTDQQLKEADLYLTSFS